MIPKDAKLVFKGVLFDVYQWQQEMFDGSFRTYERLRRKPSVTVLPITAEGKLMLCEEEQPGRGKFLSTPGGQVEAGESPEHAAERELLEETGYTGRLEFWMTSQPYGNKIEWEVHNYIVRDCYKVTEQHLDAGERITPIFLDFELFIDAVLTSPNFRNVETIMAVVQAMRTPSGLEGLKKFLG